MEMDQTMQANPGAVAQPLAVQTIADLLGLGSSRKFIFVFIAIGALLLALAMRFGFPGLGSAASTALGAAAAKSAVSVHTGPAPSFKPEGTTTTSPSPLANAEPAALVAEPAVEELAPIAGGANVSSGSLTALEEVSAPKPSTPAPTIVPSSDPQEAEVEVLC